jgi:hypothetical protein
VTAENAALLSRQAFGKVDLAIRAAEGKGVAATSETQRRAGAEIYSGWRKISCDLLAARKLANQSAGNADILIEPPGR